MAGQQLCLCGGTPSGIRTNGDWSRAHGWTLPLHPLQGVAFLFLAMFALLHFGVLVPSLPHESPWKLAATLVIGLVFCVHVLVLLTCMSLNPGDPNVRMNAGGSKEGSKTFDRSQRPHVILDQYCCICQVKVGIKSKHCSACNKCISDFDHHCKWLNNCIGGRNYKLFLICVSSALIGCLFIFVTSLSLITAYFFHDSWLNQPLSMRVSENSTRLATFDPPMNLTGNATHPSHLHYQEGHVFWVFLPVTGMLWLVTVVTTSLLSVAACALLTHLLAFHAYLISQNLSTYEYIVQKREAASGVAGQPRNFGNHSGRGTGGQLVKKGLLCPLKKWRRFKMANQILPMTNKDEAKPKDSEMAVANPDKTSCAVPNTDSRNLSSGAVEESETQSSLSVPSSADQQTLEQRACDIYLGSPLHRSRRLLPPIGHPDSARGTAAMAANLGAFMQNVTQGETEETREKTNGETQAEASPSDDCSSDIATSSLPSLPDTEPMDTDLPPPASNLCARHLSISTQSLNSKEEQMPDDSPSSCHRLDTNIKLSGSLSNLLILDSTCADENEEDDEYELDDVEDVVQEVNIVQSPYHQTKREQLLFCPGKRRSESVNEIVGSELSLRQDDDVSISDMCSLDPNFADETLCARSLTRKRPSVDVLFVPLGIESAFDVTESSRNENTFIILRTDRDAKAHRFDSPTTNFMNDPRRRIQQQLIV